MMSEQQNIHCCDSEPVGWEQTVGMRFAEFPLAEVAVPMSASCARPRSTRHCRRQEQGY